MPGEWQPQLVITDIAPLQGKYLFEAFVQRLLFGYTPIWWHPAPLPVHCSDSLPVPSHVRDESADLSPDPELPEDEPRSEAELDSDEETSLQWLSDPPPEFGRHLSGFGQLFTLLEGLVTERSSQLLRGSGHAQSTEVPQRSSLQVSSIQHRCSCLCILRPHGLPNFNRRLRK